MAKKQAPMQWEVKDLNDGRWGIFLKQEFCRTEEPVCYGASHTRKGALKSVARLNAESLANSEED